MMCTQRPCKCSCDLHRVADVDAVLHGPAGSFFIGSVQDGGHSYRMLWVKLPCEGGELHGLPLRPAQTSEKRASWEFDGNEERPTLTPSVATWREPTKGQRQEVWHGFITNGRAVSC